MLKAPQLFYFGVFIVLVILMSVSAPLDGDLWWQMEYGRQILETGSLRSDHTIYSWTKSSNALIYCAWIAQVVLFIIHDNFGMLGLNLFRVLILSTPILLCWVLAKRLNVELQAWHWAIAFLTFYVSNYAGGMLKPELFGYLCFSVLVFLYLRAKCDTKRDKLTPEIYLIPLVTLIWVNSHGTFTMAGAFLFFALIGEMINTKVSSDIALNSEQWRRIRIIIPFTAISILITPYGFEWPYQIVSKVITPENDAHFKSVFAYQSIFREQIAHLQIREVFITLGVIAALLFLETIKHRRFDFALFGLNIFFLSVANGWGRASYFSPILLLFTIVYLSSRSPFLNDKTKYKKISQVVVFLILAGVSIFALKKAEVTVLGDQKGHYLSAGFLNPEASAEFYQNHLLGQKFCNGYNGGGYLIWKFEGKQKVMIDPRYFPYVEWYTKWVEMKEGKNIKRHVDSLDCNVWILGHPYTKISSYLSDSEDWKLAFVGRAASIFVKSDMTEWKERPLELERGLGETPSLTQTARIINTLIRSKNLDAALDVADDAREFWKDSLNQGRSERAYEFVLGNKYFAEKKDLLALELLESAHEEPAVITNGTRLQATRLFATQLLWTQKEYARAFDISVLTLEKEPNNPMLMYNTAFLYLLVKTNKKIDWRANLTKMLETEQENKLGVPVKYFDHARTMLESGKPVNAAPLKYADKR